jgi:hypothetical protein
MGTANYRIPRMPLANGQTFAGYRILRLLGSVSSRAIRFSFSCQRILAPVMGLQEHGLDPSSCFAPQELLAWARHAGFKDGRFRGNAAVIMAARPCRHHGSFWKI